MLLHTVNTIIIDLERHVAIIMGYTTSYSPLDSAQPFGGNVDFPAKVRPEGS